MRVVLVNGYRSDSVDADTGEVVASLLRHDGHDVEVLDVGDQRRFLSADEHVAYESGEPLVAEDTRRDALLVQKAEALVFCYPTTLFTVPAALKGWLERVMVPGVAFVFNDKNKVRPGLTSVRRLAVVTTSPHSDRRTRRARDLGRRTVLRTLRLNCHPLCRRTFVSLASGLPAEARRQRLSDRLVGW